MSKYTREHINSVLAHFNLDGIESCEPYGNGHINDTYLVVCKNQNGTERYILQSINGSVFPEPKKVIQNIEKVTAFLSKKITDKRALLSLVPTKDGEHCHLDADGRCWRIYNFIEDSLCLENPENAEDFYQCAVAFGQFQKNLSDFPA